MDENVLFVAYIFLLAVFLRRYVTCVGCLRSNVGAYVESQHFDRAEGESRTGWLPDERIGRLDIPKVSDEIRDGSIDI